MQFVQVGRCRKPMKHSSTKPNIDLNYSKTRNCTLTLVEPPLKLSLPAESSRLVSKWPHPLMNHFLLLICNAKLKKKCLAVLMEQTNEMRDAFTNNFLTKRHMILVFLADTFKLQYNFFV